MAYYMRELEHGTPRSETLSQEQKESQARALKQLYEDSYYTERGPAPNEKYAMLGAIEDAEIDAYPTEKGEEVVRLMMQALESRVGEMQKSVRSGVNEQMFQLESATLAAMRKAPTLVEKLAAAQEYWSSPLGGGKPREDVKRIMKNLVMMKQQPTDLAA
jgi:hypothetical protein